MSTRPAAQHRDVLTRITLSNLQHMHATGEKIAILTCYDASFAALLESCDIDALLIGDSLGMVIQGHDSTLPVSMDDMCYHTTAVARGCRRPFLIADMPFGSTGVSPQHCYENAVRLIQAGATMVKIEGGQHMADTTEHLSLREVLVCAHIGLMPQSVHQLGGYKIQGLNEVEEARLLADALAQQEAGAAMLLIEAVPASLAAKITQSLHIPTIGIGAGANLSGQVLVLYDMLNISQGKKARFVKNYIHSATDISQAVRNYVAEVKAGSYPAEEHTYSSSPSRQHAGSIRSKG